MPHLLGTLRFRLFVFVLIALVPAFALVIYTAAEQRQLATFQAQRDALRTASSAASSYEQLVDSTRQLLTVLEQVPAVHHAEPGACHKTLADLVAQYPRYATAGVADGAGNVLCAAVLNPPNTIGGDSFLVTVRETKDFTVGEYRFVPSAGFAVLGFGYPLLDESRQLQGIVYAATSLAFLNELAAQAMLPPGSTLSMRDRNGTIVARYPDPGNWVGTARPDVAMTGVHVGSANGQGPGPQSVPAVRGDIGYGNLSPAGPLIDQGEGTFEALGTDGIVRLYVLAPLPGPSGNGLQMTVGIPSDVAFANANQTLQRNLITMGLVALLAIGAAWIGGDWFLIRRVKALSIVTNRLAAGDLTARTGLGYGVGELDQLARAFDRMVAALEQRQAERRQAEDQVRRWSTQVQGLLKTAAEASSQPLQVSKIVDIALCRTLDVMGLAAGCVFLKQDEDYLLAAHRGLAAAAACVAKCQSGQAATSEIASLMRSGLVQDVSESALVQALSSGAESFQTWVSVPFQSKGHTFGMMCLASQDCQLLERNEQGVLSALGQQIGVAIENAELYSQVRSMAALKERERLGRELHDGLAQVLGYLIFRGDVAADLVAAGQLKRAEQELREMRAAMKQAYEDVREDILGFQTTIPPRGGLVSTLEEYVRKFRLQTGIEVDLLMSDSAPQVCSPEAQVQLLRIMQEALANARKHSGAKHAWIRFELQAESLVVTIQDNGKGFDANSVGENGQPPFGLKFMQERAESVGGSLLVWSRPGQGTRVVVTLARDGRGE